MISSQHMSRKRCPAPQSTFVSAGLIRSRQQLDVVVVSIAVALVRHSPS